MRLAYLVTIRVPVVCARQAVVFSTGFLLLLAAGCSDKGASLDGSENEGVRSKIAFVSNRDGNDEIYVIDADGANLTRLTHDRESDQRPTWSPDGARIAFIRGYKLYTMKADGSDLVYLTDGATPGQNPYDPDGTNLFYRTVVAHPQMNLLAWSPNASRIALVLLQNVPLLVPSGGYGDSWEYFSIYVVNTDGTNLTRLLGTLPPPPGRGTGIVEYLQPAWSPDGTKIAFLSYRDNNADLYVAQADGTNETRVTTADARESTPNWAPDGTKIAFVQGSNASWGDIYVINADGTNPTRLTNDAISAQPTWSPDGTKMAFSSTRGGHIIEIYVMNADGTNQTRLTENPSFGLLSDPHDMQPAWSPFLR